jgi:DnaJ-class molecular chaperone
MAGKSKTVLHAMKEADDWIHLFTGKRTKDLAKKWWDLYGDDVQKKVNEILTDFPDDNAMDSPYKVLGAHPLDSDALVRAKFREACMKYHGDFTTTPDAAKFEAVVAAYEAIKMARHPKAPEDM